MGEVAAIAGFCYAKERLEADLSKALEQLRWREQFKSDSAIFVKPNFTLPFYKPGVTTTGELVETMLGILKNRVSEVFVGEADGGSSSFTADDSLKGHGIPEMCRRTGAEILNLSTIERTRIGDRVNGRYVEVTIPSRLLNMDQSISMPVLKVHVVTQVSLSLKNMWGCHPDTLRLLDHTHLGERIALIARLVHLNYAVVDGIYGLNERGPMDGQPVRIGTILVGNNPVATDATAARLLGFRADKIPHIVAANKAGLGPLREEEIRVLDDLGQFQQKFWVQPNLVDILGALTFRSGILTRLVFDSDFTGPIYRFMRRQPRRRIVKPGDEL